jgi:hypothetical protein
MGAKYGAYLHPVFGNLQPYPYGFAPIQDRDARLILSKDLLVSKTPSAYLLNQQQTTVKIIPGRRCGIHPAQPLLQHEPP